MTQLGLGEHIKKVAHLYQFIDGSQELNKNRSGNEADLWNEITQYKKSLQITVSNLKRPNPIGIKVGDPKGRWAHCYYVSFHDPYTSNSPGEGYYPALLMSLDQKKAWITVMLSANSVDIKSGGGWSIKRGNMLKEHASYLSGLISNNLGWRKGQIDLGENGTYIHRTPGSKISTPRGYECGTIISKDFNPNDPPPDLDLWIENAFSFYDEIREKETPWKTLANTNANHSSDREEYEQENAAILGREAEEKFLEWVTLHRPDWGEPKDKTNKVGLGFDIHFPGPDIFVEVKGCRHNIADLRFTKREWEEASRKRDKYYLALVTGVRSKQYKVYLVQDPHTKLSDGAEEQSRLQITHSIKKNHVEKIVL